MRVLKLILCWLTLWSAAPQAWAQIFVPVPIQQRTVSASTTTLDPASIAPGGDATLSGGNLIATGVGTAVTFAQIVSIGNHSSGKYFFSTALTAVNVNPGGFGITTSPGTSTACPTFGGCVLTIPGGSVFDQSFGSLGTMAAYGTAGDVVDEAVDLTGQLIWFRVNGGNWNNNGTANPATGTGGFSFTTITGSTPYYAFIFLCNSPSCVFTTNFGASAYTYAAPSGFVNW